MFVLEKRVIPSNISNAVEKNFACVTQGRLEKKFWGQLLRPKDNYKGGLLWVGNI